MRLTALDIREQQFRRTMRGLDPDEVVTFLGAVANEYEQLVSENRDLRQRLLDLEHQIGEFRSMEKALRDTLLTAERVTAETKENAHKEAELILRQAEVAAQESTAHISSEILQKRRELTELQRKKKDYLLSVRALAQSHLAMVDSDANALDAELAASNEPAVVVPRVVVAPAEAFGPVAASPLSPPPVNVEVVPVQPREHLVASQVPTEVGGVIPSAVPVGDGVPLMQPAAAPALPVPPGVPVVTAPPVALPQGDWAEAAFEPGDLVPRNNDASMSVRSAEHYRRGIEPNKTLPSLLREPGGEVPATVEVPLAHPMEQVMPPEVAPSTDGDTNWPTHAVRPDGNQGD